MDILSYKGYEGTAEIDMDRGVCRGKVLFISDLITYEAGTPKELKQEFETAVDDYLATCTELGREPKRPCSGVFNVRVTPEMHRKATLRAVQDNASLNSVVVCALDAYLNAQSKVDHNHHHEITVRVENESMTSVATTAATAGSDWGSNVFRLEERRYAN
jgi:predicted HicB family RNase H-like nuclease